MKGEEDDSESLCRTTVACRSGGLLGHAGLRWIWNFCRGWMDALPFPRLQIRPSQLLFDLTQHPCSLYCTLKKETTASALFSPAVGPSITCMKDMRYWSIGSVLRWYGRSIVAAGTDTIFGPSVSSQSWRVQWEKRGKYMIVGTVKNWLLLG